MFLVYQLKANNRVYIDKNNFNPDENYLEYVKKGRVSFSIMESYGCFLYLWCVSRGELQVKRSGHLDPSRSTLGPNNLDKNVDFIKNLVR